MLFYQFFLLKLKAEIDHPDKNFFNLDLMMKGRNFASPLC